MQPRDLPGVPSSKIENVTFRWLNEPVVQRGTVGRIGMTSSPAPAADRPNLDGVIFTELPGAREIEKARAALAREVAAEIGRLLTAGKTRPLVNRGALLHWSEHFRLPKAEPWIHGLDGHGAYLLGEARTLIALKAAIEAGEFDAYDPEGRDAA